MPSDVALDPERRPLHRRHAPQPRPPGRRADAHHHDRRRQRPLGQLGRRRAGDEGDAWPARPASRSCPKPAGRSTLFIADYYNGHVRAVGPDGIIRDVSDEGREALRRADARGVCDAGRSAAGSTSPTRASDTGRAAHHPDASRPNLGRATAPATPRAHAADGRARADERSRRRPCCRGRCRSCARTAAAWLLVGVLLLLGDRARRAAALAAEGRHRLRARAASRFREPFAGWLPAMHAGQPRSSLLVVVVVAGVVLQVVNQSSSAYSTQVQVDTGQRMVYDLRCRLVPAPAGARPAPPHHDQHRRRGLPRRRRRVRDREPA